MEYVCEYSPSKSFHCNQGEISYVTLENVGILNNFFHDNAVKQRSKKSLIYTFYLKGSILPTFSLILLLDLTLSFKHHFFNPCPRTFFFIALRERGRKGERETSVGCLLVCMPTREWTCTLGLCPEQESNPRPFSLWDDAPTSATTLAPAKHHFSSHMNCGNQASV